MYIYRYTSTYTYIQICISYIPESMSNDQSMHILQLLYRLSSWPLVSERCHFKPVKSVLAVLAISSTKCLDYPREMLLPFSSIHIQEFMIQYTTFAYCPTLEIYHSSFKLRHFAESLAFGNASVGHQRSLSHLSTWRNWDVEISAKLLNHLLMDMTCSSCLWRSLKFSQ